MLPIEWGTVWSCNVAGVVAVDVSDVIAAVFGKFASISPVEKGNVDLAPAARIGDEKFEPSLSSPRAVFQTKLGG